jgi:hypothetical protein
MERGDRENRVPEAQQFLIPTSNFQNSTSKN